MALQLDAAPQELIVVLSHHPLRAGGWLTRRTPNAGSNDAPTHTLSHPRHVPPGRLKSQDVVGVRRFVRVVAGVVNGR